MSLKIGIVGLPNVGKSTLFQALTQKTVDTSNYPFATINPNIGVVEVHDDRIIQLSVFSKSARTIPAIIEFVDIAGLVKGASEGAGKGNDFLQHIREVDAIVQVVRAFENTNIIHVESSVNPLRDREIIDTELLLADLSTAEKTLVRAEKNIRAGTKEAKEELALAQTLVQEIKSGKRPQSETFTYARSLNLLTAKPILYLYNTTTDPLPTAKPGELYLNIKLEEELSHMSADEQQELGITPRLDDLARAAYELLGLMSYFTTGEDETRAWTIPIGSTAKRAGRAIHSDFEEKFIRAEIIFWKDLLDAGSYAKARERGLLRTEGKDYIVKDGDVIEFKI